MWEGMRKGWRGKSGATQDDERDGKVERVPLCFHGAIIKLSLLGCTMLRVPVIPHSSLLLCFFSILFHPFALFLSVRSPLFFARRLCYYRDNYTYVQSHGIEIREENRGRGKNKKIRQWGNWWQKSRDKFGNKRERKVNGTTMSCGTIPLTVDGETSFEGVCLRKNIGHTFYRDPRDLKRNESISLEKCFPWNMPPREKKGWTDITYISDAFQAITFVTLKVQLVFFYIYFYLFTCVPNLSSNSNQQKTQ